MGVVKRACLVRSGFACITWALVLVVPLFELSSAQVSNWTKQPTDPLFGVLGENVSLEWKFTLTGNDSISDFRLEQWHGFDQEDIVIYRPGKKVQVHPQFEGKFGFETNATHPAFILINAKTSDEAKYCCKVSTRKAYGGRRCTNLQILVRPNITEISRNQTLNETNDVTLSCNAIGKPPPNVTWSSPGNKDKKYPGSVLPLKNISREQDGEDWCTATNRVGNATASVRVTVNYAPSITPNSTRYNFTEGNDIELRCVTDGRPQPTVTWTKIGGSSNIAYPDRQTLIITNANRTEAGTYRCTATNDIGDGASATIHVNVFFPPSIHRGPANRTVNESGDLELSCNTTGNPSPNITWSKVADPSVKLAADEVLKVKNVSKNDSGVYQCLASNGIGRDALASWIVTVNYKPRGTRLTSDTQNDAVKESSQVTFFCTAESVPPAELELRFDGSSLGFFNNGRFTLKHINASNQGAYECVPRNILGTGPEATLNLTVLVPPSIYKGPTNKTVNESSDLELFCNATGNPPPNITWSKVADPPVQLSFDEVLTVENINKTDSGVYQCRASNGIGSGAFASSTVTVRYKPEGTRLTSDAHNDAVTENSQVTFHCTADSVPPPELELLFDNSSLGFFINSKFAFENVNASNQGTYRCVPRNILGTGPEATLNLTVLVSPSIDYISQNTTVNETDDVILFCNSTGNPSPNITWKFLDNSANVTFGEPLSLQLVNRSQAGTYRCTATNGATSHAWADVHVQVNYKPEMKDGSSVIKSWINHETEVTCEAVGFPAPEIAWSRNGTVTSSTTLYSCISTLKFTPEEKNEFGILLCSAKNLLGTAKKNVTVKQLVVPAPPRILRIDSGVDNMEIHWEVSAVDPDSPVLNYLVQVKEKDGSHQWMNCARITPQKSSGSMLCVMNELKSDTEYIVRIAARNIVGYSAFTVKQSSTKQEKGKKDEQKGLPRSTLYGITAAAICFLALIIIIVAIVCAKKRRLRSQGINKEVINGSSKKVTISSYDNPAMESQIPKTEEDPQLILNC